jgi:hypothetical protein
MKPVNLNSPIFISMKSPIIIFLTAFFALSSLPSMAQQKARTISAEELSALVSIDPAYKNEISLDDQGNYLDNNPIDYYILLKAKVETAKRNELNLPVNADDAADMLDKFNNVALPEVIITGNEVNDISRYKQTITLWMQDNLDKIKYLDAETQGMINAQDYISLYTKQVMLNNVRKN